VIAPRYKAAMNDELVGDIAKKVFKRVGRSMGAGALTSVFDDHKGRDVIVPYDLHLAKLPPVAADGTAECWRCHQRLPFAQLDIAGEAYVCRGCALKAAQQAAQLEPIDVDHVKIGRGRWWILPLCIAGAGAVTAALMLM
jgi:hypothetical protein